MRRTIPSSLSLWCVAPALPVNNPAYAARTFTLRSLYATVTYSWSTNRRVKASNVQGKGMYPSCDRPAAMLTMSCSAMPALTSLAGWKCSKMWRPVELRRSASRARIFGNSDARSASA